MGVAVKTDSTSFVIHPKVIFRLVLSSDFDAPLTKYTSSASALIDFAGKTSTATLAASADAGDALSYVMNAPFADGSNGYLPAAGQLNTIRSNFTNINSAMALIGGFTFERSGVSDVNFNSTSSNYIYFSTTYNGYWSYAGSYMYWIWYGPERTFNRYSNGASDPIQSFVLTDF